MKKNISSKITYAARLVAKKDRSYGGWYSEYNPYDTIINLLQLRESKHKDAEKNNKVIKEINKVFIIFSKFFLIIKH